MPCRWCKPRLQRGASPAVALPVLLGANGQGLISAVALDDALTLSSVPHRLTAAALQNSGSVAAGDDHQPRWSVRTGLERRGK
jgi:hypothetical protein